MSVSNPCIVVVRLSQDDSLGEAMSAIRIWLDAEKIQPSLFTSSTGGAGSDLRFSFDSAEDAERFRSQFSQILNGGISSRDRR